MSADQRVNDNRLNCVEFFADEDYLHKWTRKQDIGGICELL